MENYGFLLLTSHLGNPERKPLTPAQLRTLSQRVLSQGAFEPGELTEKELHTLGCGNALSSQILDLLADTELLERYLQKAKIRKCVPIQRTDARYPVSVRKKLGLDSPGCLWAKGDLSLLDKPKISVVGSRKPKPESRTFAYEAGRQAARQGFVLVSGNAAGADQAAQQGCLDAGGQVLSLIHI